MAIPARLKSFRVIAALVLIVLFLIVAWQNSAPAGFYFLGFSSEMPLMLWLGLFLSIGFLLGVGLMWSLRRRHGSESTGRDGVSH